MWQLPVLLFAIVKCNCYRVHIRRCRRSGFWWTIGSSGDDIFPGVKCEFIERLPVGANSYHDRSHGNRSIDMTKTKKEPIISKAATGTGRRMVLYLVLLAAASTTLVPFLLLGSLARSSSIEYEWFYRVTMGARPLEHPPLPNTIDSTEPTISSHLSGSSSSSSSSNNSRSRIPFPTPDFVMDWFCPQCRHQIINARYRCGAHLPPPPPPSIVTTAAISNTTTGIWPPMAREKAGEVIDASYPTICRHCYPTACTPSEKRYWRYDRVIPSSHLYNTTILHLSSIPHRFGIGFHPNNVSDYLQQHRGYPNFEYWFDYNPSIITLPAHIRRERQQLWNQTVTYLISLRVSNQHSCLHPEDRKRMNGGNVLSSNNYDTVSGQRTSSSPPKPNNWLGLAFINHDFQIVADTVIDLKPVGFPNAEDFRLFFTHNQMYITSYDLIAPIYLGQTPHGNHFSAGPKHTPSHDSGGGDNSVNIVLVPMVPLSGAKQLSNFGPVYIRPFPSCAPCARKNNKYKLCGKNFNYFAADSSSSQSTEAANNILAEIWPSSPHQVRFVNISAPCDRSGDPVTYIDHYEHDANVKYSNNSIIAPIMSFATTEQVHFPYLDSREMLLTRGRGGACCIRARHPYQKRETWWHVGVQHSKTPSQRTRGTHLPPNVTGNHYVSSFYAFTTEPPYRITARSGYFCLGFRQRNERVYQGQYPYSRITEWRKLELGTTYDCPRIHFVSGIAYAVDDPSMVILVYGVNDCYSRFVQISVADIWQLLLGDIPL